MTNDEGLSAVQDQQSARSQVEAHMEEAKGRITASNRWISAFFFVLLALWLPNYALDFSSAERGLPHKRVVEANEAVNSMAVACFSKSVAKDCEAKKEFLEKKLASLNDDIDIVFFKIPRVNIKYQSLFICVIALSLFVCILWSRYRILSLAFLSVQIFGNAPIPSEFRLSSPPPWLWPLHLPSEKHVSRVAFFETLGARSNWQAKALLGYSIFIFLIFISGHTFIVHKSISDVTLGGSTEITISRSDVLYAESQNNQNINIDWSRYPELELPWPMSFSGHHWVDIFVIIGCFAVAYFVVDLMTVLKAGKARLASEFSTREWVSSTRRAALVSGVLVGFVAVDAAKGYLPKFGASLLGRPRFRNRNGYRDLMVLSRPEGLYINLDFAKLYNSEDDAERTLNEHFDLHDPRSLIVHFVRSDETAQDLYFVDSDRLVPVPTSMIDFGAQAMRINRRHRSQAIEWSALERIGDNDAEGAIEILVRALEQDLREGRGSFDPNLRLFDLASGLAYRKGYPSYLSRLIGIANNTVNEGHLRSRLCELLKNRIARWSDVNGGWRKKWNSDSPRTWDGIDI